MVTKTYKRRTKIVCTIGPASRSTLMIERLLRAGMNVSRLNLSHGSYQEHKQYISTIRTASQHLSLPVAILIDLPGPKYRIGKLAGDSVLLKDGSQVILTPQPGEGSKIRIPVNPSHLARDIKAGNIILIDDGALQLQVQKIRKDDIWCRVIVGGNLTSGRGVVVPGMKFSDPFITPKLIKSLDFALKCQPDYLALSFVSNVSDVEQVRDIIKSRGADIPIIVKIERGQAVANFSRILAVSDGIMVARGDLGIDIPLERVPMVQKDIIHRCNLAGKPVITATQMLESMVSLPSPTRAEVTDVANAIFDGTDALMLSAETATGSFPVRAVKMMARIARETEAHIPYEHRLWERGEGLARQTDEAISYDACRTAHQLGAVAIVAFTRSGSTARRISKYRPQMPTLSITPDEAIARRLLLFWGVYPFPVASPSSLDELFSLGAKLPKHLGLAKAGDSIIITGGIPIGVPGATNLLKVEQII